MPESARERPWTDANLLRRLYIDEGMSAVAISEMWDCSSSTVGNWLDEHGIEKRSQEEAVQLALGQKHVTFTTHSKGYEVWWIPGFNVYVHRLVAVAEYGLEALKGKKVHHENEIPWDNRPENLELLTTKEHRRKHLKVKEADRRKIADIYELTDKSSYQVADEIEQDICSATVRDIHEEYYGGEE